MGLTSKDKYYKENKYLTLNDISKLLNKGRYTLNTVISYLYIEPLKVKEGKIERCFFNYHQFNQIKNFYIKHPDYSKFLSKEMRIRKNGGNGYTEERNIKTRESIISRYGENWKQILSDKTQKAIEEKYGNKNYRNVEKMKQTLHNNRNKFCMENDCILFSEKFGTSIIHSWQTLERIMNKLDIHLISYKSCLYIKNKDVKPLELELEKVKDNYSHISLGEKEIEDFIKSLNIEYVANDRDILNGKELDIYIPDKKVAIEFDGLYYHCELFKDRNYHLNKTLDCEKKNIRLVHIFEDEWIYKQNICKSIIASSLGIYKNKYMARKCNIRELTSKDYKEFLEKNHLQGYAPSKYKIGLFYNNILVQCIGVSDSRFEKGKIELVRLCTLQDTQVVGGFSKLIKYVVRKYNVSSIISYVDRRVFNGSGYKSSNFKIIGYSKPSYQYIKGTLRYNRMNFQKKYLNTKLTIYNKDLTEHQNMINNGYYQIFDCGTIKVEYTEK